MTDDARDSRMDELRLGRIGIYGDLVDTFRVVKATRSSPVILMGTYNGEQILAPFVELTLVEDADDDSEGMMLSAVVPFENMAFLLESLTEDFQINCDALVSMSGGSRKPASDRMALAISYLTQARANLDACLENLHTLEGAPAPPTRRRRLRRPDTPPRHDS
jgi:hypothetical protein